MRRTTAYRPIRSGCTDGRSYPRSGTALWLSLPPGSGLEATTYSYDAVVNRRRRSIPSGLLGWLRYLASPTRRAETLYDLAADRLLIANASAPLANMGFWRNVDPAAPNSLERANLALFDLVNDAAGLDDASRVVDAGSGFGLNAIRVARRAPNCAVVGINRSQVQIAMSRELAGRAGLADRIRFLRADVHELPFADASVDRVLSVEAAFHFHARDRFFAEVYRALVPGGWLSMVDLVPLPPRGPVDRVAWRFTRRGLAIPDANVTTLDAYRASLERAGLEVTVFRSIVADVYPAFRRWQLRQPLRALVRVPPLLALSSAGFLFYPWDYVQVVARRPMQPHDVLRARGR